MERFLTETDQTVQKIITSHLRILASSLRVVATGLRLLRRTSNLRVIYGKINQWTVVIRFLTCQKIRLSFHGYQRVTYGCLRVTTSWPSVTTRKKNPCMCTPCYNDFG